MSFEVGQRVAVYDAFSEDPSGVAVVDKIYKTGHVIVNGIKYRPATNGWAHETGTGYARGHIRALTPDVELAVRHALKVRRLRRLADWLRGANPDDVPNDIVGALTEACNTATQKAKTSS